MKRVWVKARSVMRTQELIFLYFVSFALGRAYFIMEVKGVKITMTTIQEKQFLHSLEQAIDETPGDLGFYLDAIRRQMELAKKMNTKQLEHLERLASKYPDLRIILEPKENNLESQMGDTSSVAVVVVDVKSLPKATPTKAKWFLKHKTQQKTERPTVASIHSAIQHSGGYLTTKEVADLLGVSPQMVRTYCQQSVYEASRTMGDRGEWRIDAKDFFGKNPHLAEGYVTIVNDRKRSNLDLVKAITSLSENDEYLKALNSLEESRNRNESEEQE